MEVDRPGWRGAMQITGKFVLSLYLGVGAVSLVSWIKDLQRNNENLNLDPFPWQDIVNQTRPVDAIGYNNSLAAFAAVLIVLSLALTLFIGHLGRRSILTALSDFSSVRLPRGFLIPTQARSLRCA
ncbi:MAG: hypothetical protein HRF49_00860 [bacterium]